MFAVDQLLLVTRIVFDVLFFNFQRAYVCVGSVFSKITNNISSKRFRLVDQLPLTNVDV